MIDHLPRTRFFHPALASVLLGSLAALGGEPAESSSTRTAERYLALIENFAG